MNKTLLSKSVIEKLLTPNAQSGQTHLRLEPVIESTLSARQTRPQICRVENLIYKNHYNRQSML